MTEKQIKRYLTLTVVMLALGGSFLYSPSWLQLCYGLALFLFGMQCIEEGLRSAAGGKLERWMSQSTATPSKGLFFGMAATFILQSSTLVSLLTIAFLSTGMITLAGGIAIILGTNLGATSGIWLLALAGQSISLSAAAMPMLVFGTLMHFTGERSKIFGRVLIGIALILIGIDAIRDGFQAFGAGIDFSRTQIGGMAETLAFFAVGFILTLVLQSSHATLLLTLAALGGGQINLMQGFAIAVGSNVGSSATTALVGMVGSDRNGKRLALAHAIFNIVTALTSLILWLPLTQAVTRIAERLGMGPLLQLALFHTMFNLLGVLMFWKAQNFLAELLQRQLPDKTPEKHPQTEAGQADQPRYLQANVLLSGDTALAAVEKEIGHLDEISMEVMCSALFIPVSCLYEESDDEGKNLPAPQPPLELDVPQLYEKRVKPLYSAILDFTSGLETANEAQQQRLARCYNSAWLMVEIVNESKHLQKNMQQYLLYGDSPVTRDYQRLRRHVFKTLRLFRRIAALPEGEERQEWLEKLAAHSETLGTFRGRIMVKLRNNEINGWQTSSLLNDINYARRIGRGAAAILG
ncbi:MAG: Na/Pi symporter [Neisseria sp.]|nr:Na/Pi symporter [Neisseria sp.]